MCERTHQVGTNTKRGRYAGDSLCSGLFFPYANVLTEYVIFSQNPAGSQNPC